MRILIIMGGFFPGKKYGGPPVSVDNFCTLMNEECFIVTTNHDLYEKEIYKNISKGWNERENSKVIYLADQDYNKEFFERIIKEVEPDLLYLQGLFQSCVLPCLQLARKRKLKVLLAPRGELCKGAMRFKWYKKVPYIIALKAMGLTQNVFWQSTSEEETKAIKRWMNTTDDRIYELCNIPSCSRGRCLQKEKNVGEGKFIFLSRIHPKKNLLKAIEFFHGIKGKAVFDIYGPIEDREYWEYCESEIKKLPQNIKVEYKGMVAHEDVHDTFSRYDAFLFPTFSENYGHVIAESLIAGTAVITSNQTPWQDLEKSGIGWDIPIIQEEEYIRAINVIIESNQADMECIAEKATSYVNNKFEYERLRKLYQSALNEIVRGR